MGQAKKKERTPHEVKSARMALCDRCRSKMKSEFKDRLIEHEERRVDFCSFCANRWAVQSCELWPPARPRYLRGTGGGERQRAGR